MVGHMEPAVALHQQLWDSNNSVKLTVLLQVTPYQQISIAMALFNIIATTHARHLLSQPQLSHQVTLVYMWHQVQVAARRYNILAILYHRKVGSQLQPMVIKIAHNAVMDG